MKINKPFNQNALAEIMQQKKVRLAFARKENENEITQIHQYILCRDFLNEVLQGNSNGKEYYIYGFNYKPSKETKLDSSATQFLYSVPDKEDELALKKNIQILNQYETMSGLTETVFENVADNQFYIRGDKFWQKTGYLISLYTFMLRAMAYVYKDQKNWIAELIDYHTNESNYANSVGKTRLHYILCNLSKLPVIDSDPTGWGDNPDTGMLHNYTGFVSTFTLTSYASANKYHKPIKEFLEGCKC